eukprot:CAMPEP_0115595510 /NCGR_PEP_ID=MMETSP0272-20121206/12357_1 /TAXON_ID=71861 /ORGANISM="Scrippsiella trochoidea, Strain CCMP3099" /LENGTH=48 /DNA_ID= /DNA_START= /DNA_END= /DNA_ORIENTATION=
MTSSMLWRTFSGAKDMCMTENNLAPAMTDIPDSASAGSGSSGGLSEQT